MNERVEFCEGSSNKFWEVEVSGNEVHHAVGAHRDGRAEQNQDLQRWGRRVARRASATGGKDQERICAGEPDHVEWLASGGPGDSGSDRNVAERGAREPFRDGSKPARASAHSRRLD